VASTAAGNPVDRIVLQFRRESDGRLTGLRPVAPGAENTDKGYGRLTLRRSGTRVVIEAAQGTGAQDILRVLATREFVELGSELRCQSYFQPSREQELSGITAEQVSTWFTAVAATGEGGPLDRIVLQFQRGSDGRLTALRPVAPGTENTGRNYGRLALSRSGVRVVIESAEGTGAQDILRILGAREFVEITPGLSGMLIGEYFQPSREGELSGVTAEQVSTWFTAVEATGGGGPLDRIVLQFNRKSDGRLTGLRPVAPGAENTGKSYGRLTLRRSGTRVVIEAAQGTGAQDILRILGAREFVEIAPGLSGMLIGEYFQPSREQELSSVTPEQVSTWFTAVAATGEGGPLDRIVLQFQRGSDGRLRALRPVAPGTENESPGYGRLTLSRSGTRIVIETAQGNGAQDVLRILGTREFVELGSELRRQSYFQPSREQELSGVTAEQVMTWFTAVEVTAAGRPLDRIVLQFNRKSDGRLTGLRPVAPGSENASGGYGWLTLSRSGRRVVIEAAKGNGVRRVLEILRQSPAAQGASPVLVIAVGDK